MTENKEKEREGFLPQEGEMDPDVVRFLNEFAMTLDNSFKEKDEQNFAYADSTDKKNYPFVYTKNYVLTYTNKLKAFSVFIVITADSRSVAADIKRLEKFAQANGSFEFNIAKEYALVDVKNQRVLWGEAAENKYGEIRLQSIINEYKLIDSMKTGQYGDA